MKIKMNKNKSINSNFYFEGWYLKHQANGKTIALIPGIAKDGPFIHIVTNKKSWFIKFAESEYFKTDECILIGNNIFSLNGISIDINRPEIKISGEIIYKNTTPIKNDIMGPFRFFPMECKHLIKSMIHDLTGQLTIDNEVYDFNGGKGFIEGDSGTSFPSAYTWVHANDFNVEKNISIVAAVAKIPFYGLKFWGCICVVMIDSKEYRLATYKNVKILLAEKNKIRLKQGKYILDITIDSSGGHWLPAPRRGIMDNLILEDLSCPAHFKFTYEDKIIFEGESTQTSYEFHELNIKNKSV